MKNYEDFKKDFLKNIKGELELRGIEDVTCKYETINAPDGMNDRLNVSVGDSRTAMSFRVQAYYNDVNNGVDLLAAASTLVDIVEEMMDQVRAKPEQSLNEFVFDYDQVKENLYLRLVPGTSPAVANSPHKLIADMALVANIDISADAFPLTGSGGSILITNDLLREYGISEEQLFTDARDNSVEKNPIVLKPLVNEIARMSGQTPSDTEEVENPTLYVVTTTEKTHGAAVLAYPNFADIVKDNIGKNVWVIPSSVHDLILIKDMGEPYEARRLDTMIREINGTMAARDVLSNQCYHYDAVEKKLTVGMEYEAYKDKAEGINPADLIKDSDRDNDVDI